MKMSLKVVLTAAAVVAATSGPVWAAESSTREAIRHPIRTMKEKMNHNRGEASRSDQAGRAGRTSEMPTYGSGGRAGGGMGSSGMGSSGTMAGNDQYAADRERTRERARAFAESGGRSGGSTMRQGGASR